MDGYEDSQQWAERVADEKRAATLAEAEARIADILDTLRRKARSTKADLLEIWDGQEVVEVVPVGARLLYFTEGSYEVRGEGVPSVWAYLAVDDQGRGAEVRETVRAGTFRVNVERRTKRSRFLRRPILGPPERIWHDNAAEIVYRRRGLMVQAEFRLPG